MLGEIVQAIKRLASNRASKFLIPVNLMDLMPEVMY
jgi:hypothetical protein